MTAYPNATPANVATAYPNTPVNIAGTTRLFQPLDDAMAAAVVGPPTLALLAMRRSAFAIPKALPTKSVKLRCTATRAQGTARHRARCVCVTRSPSVQSEN